LYSRLAPLPTARLSESTAAVQALFAAAQHHLERARTIRETVLGEDHPFTATTYVHTGRAVAGLLLSAPAHMLRMDCCLAPRSASTSTPYPPPSLFTDAAQTSPCRSLLDCARVLCVDVMVYARVRFLSSRYYHLGSLMLMHDDPHTKALAKPLLERCLSVRLRVLGPDNPQTKAVHRIIHNGKSLSS